MQLTINGGYIYQFSIMQSACLKTYQSHFISQHITQYHSAPEIGLGWEAWPKVWSQNCMIDVIKMMYMCIYSWNLQLLFKDVGALCYNNINKIFYSAYT